jgi:outer membrane lipoprotein-sorting protein
MIRFSSMLPSRALPIALCGLFLLPCASAQQKPSDSSGLSAVLKTMDTAATNFHAIQADFEWDRYQKVIDEIIDVQMGTIYYRRAGKDIEMMANVKKAGPSAAEVKPEPKYVLFSGGKIQMYLPKPDQLTIYDLGKSNADFEGYLVLGFGGSGQELVKAFDVTDLGPATIAGVNTEKLQLVPKSEKVRNTFKQILLWINSQGISVQQQFTEPNGDYRLATYSNIQSKDKIGDDVFRLKTTGKTQTTSHGG